jgi:DNA-binding transcriptional regulator YhcF (GntR family)
MRQNMMSDPTAKLQGEVASDVLVEDILRSISEGVLKPGQRISSEQQLKEQYGIGINSIKSGLNLLVEKGVLRRRRGSGTFVTDNAGVLSKKRVACDTIAVLSNWHYNAYHPFYSEQLDGLMSGLARHGWKVRDITGSASSTKELSYQNLPSTLKLDLAQLPELAGAIFLSGDPDSFGITQLPYISTHEGSSSPFVCYDWDAEMERLFRLALKDGCRNAVVISSTAEESLKRVWSSAVKAEGLRARDCGLTVLACENSHHPTEHIMAGHQHAMSLFEKGATSYDGLIITNDFQAIGATDALSSLATEQWEHMKLYSLLNKETKLHAEDAASDHDELY